MDHLYSIIPLDISHLDEICADIKAQCDSGVATCALFMMTLVPEGNPPADKAEILCSKYAKFKEKLSSMGIPNGVLVQATIGHGWVLGQMFPYQKYVGLVGGYEENTVCPYDEGFKDYIYSALKTIALHRPDHIMIDDDFRLLGRSGGGCACPLHMKRFNELAQTNLSRDELHAIITSGSEQGKKYADIFLQAQKESLLETAKVMRAAIDSVDPSLPGSYCCVGNNAEFAAEIATILAGAVNKVIVRINNGDYTSAGARLLSMSFFRAAAQIAKLKDKVDVILAETDTCPQNRYSKGAMSLHAQFTGTVLEGAAGAKHWITRLISFEPESGKEYRKILGKYRGFYDALCEIVPSLAWRGCRIPVLGKPIFRVGKPWNMGEDSYSGWGECVLERLGLPMYFSAEPGGVLCLDGEVKLGDEILLELLKGNVFLASDSAEYLIRRGFGEYIGVDVREWNGKQPMAERLYVNGNLTKTQVKTKELAVTGEGAKIDSMVCHTVDHEHYEDLFPGTVIYKNSLGGTVFTFCGTPRANYNITEAFSFLNYSRKQQLIAMLKQAGELPAFYPGDAEMYFRAADMPGGELFCAAFNIGFDPIEKLEIVFDRAVTRIEKLMPDGTRKEIAFVQEGEKYILDTACYTLDPVVIIAS